MAQRSNPVEKKARFAVTGYSPTQMLVIGQTVSDDIKTRILSAQDVHDAPAPALKPNYAKWKGRKAPPAIRNWRLTGNTLGAAMDVFQANGTSHLGISTNATDSGGLIGTQFRVTAISATQWVITGQIVCSTTPIDPFVTS